MEKGWRGKGGGRMGVVEIGGGEDGDGGRGGKGVMVETRGGVG